MIERALWKKSLGDKAVPISVRDEDDMKKIINIRPENEN